MITKRENSVENCFKMKFVYSFDKFGFFVTRLLLIAIGVEEENGLGAQYLVLLFFFFSFFNKKKFFGNLYIDNAMGLYGGHVNSYVLRLVNSYIANEITKTLFKRFWIILQ